MKNLKHFAATVALLLCCITASAQKYMVDGIYYSRPASGAATVYVTFKSSDYNSYSGDVVIPETITYDGFVYPVTGIGNSAFKNCSDLTSVVLPASVTSIESRTFENCRNLTEVSIPETSRLTSIGNNAFNGCTSLASIVLPEGVTSIASSAFEECSSLTSIILPDGVTSLANYVFYGCTNLTSIVIPEGVTSIGWSAFKGCSSLNSMTIPESVTSIEDNTFYDCSSLTSITIPEGVTSIGAYAFYGCSSLTSITIPESVTSIGNQAFKGCAGLKELIIEDSHNTLTLGDNGYSITTSGGISTTRGLFSELPLETVYIGRNLTHTISSSSTFALLHFNECKELKSAEFGDNVTEISGGTFYGCSSLASINIPDGVTSIGTYAFYGCSSLTSINVHENVVSIGVGAFYNAGKEIFLNSKSPITLSSSSLVSSNAVIIVPQVAYNDYVSAPYWSDFAKQITYDEARIKNVVLTAEEEMSALHKTLGDEYLGLVTNLTISGSINSYDFMIMRNKMPLLRHLDLSKASIMYNEYEHYTGYHTEDNVFPPYGLYGCKLLTLIFPENITSIGYYSIYNNTALSEVIVPNGVKSIDNNAFMYCRGLTSVTLPESLTTIGEMSFYYCGKLASITFSEGLKSIGANAFTECTSLKQLILPPTVELIGGSAFSGCSSLTEIRIPSSIRSLGNYAFYDCPKLTDVYVYAVEPISIGGNTFTKNGNNFIATLHAPKVSYWDYFYDTEWSYFLSFAEFDEPYDNFYLQNDKVLDNTTGEIRGEEGDAPDAEMGDKSGIIVKDDVDQELGDVEIEHDGTDGATIIVGDRGHISAEKLNFRINVKGGRWYFFCFPFDIKRKDICLEGGAEWVFRYYDGAERAQHGNGGWKNLTSDNEGGFIKAGTGYIFQCSKNDVLVLTAKDKHIRKENKYNELVAHITQNAHDASWNFVGNPYLSYYEVTRDDYSAPITIWDGNQYKAIRPGDDDYLLAPFEAFFVQKPEGKDKVNYDSDRQYTYLGAEKAALWARARRREMPINPDRLLVNITLSDGTTTDQTRVVFNNTTSMNYEAACDAAKFSTAGVAQLYTIDSRAVKYAINERPVAEGIVTMGYTVPAQGVYTLAAPRMDAEIVVKDNLTGTIHNFADGSYEFATEAGTFDDRFVVMMKAGTTGIDKLESTDNGQQSTVIYDAAGRRVEKMEQGVYIKENRKVVKL